MRHVLKVIVTVAFITAAGCSSFQPKGGENWAGYTEVGNASFYADKHQGMKTASKRRAG